MNKLQSKATYQPAYRIDFIGRCLINAHKLTTLQRLIIACLGWWLGGWWHGNLSADDLDRSAVEFFESKIRPVLVRECYGCHSQEAQTKGKLRGGLLVDSRDGLRKGGDSGPAVVPGDTSQSLLMSAIEHQDFEMPPKGKLPAEQIEDFRKWIASGAVDPRQAAPAAQKRTIDWQQAAAHWAFQPLQLDTEQLPAASQDKPHPIDRLIHRAAELQGVAINQSADAYTLIRRAWFDLLGLPPQPEEMANWLSKLQSGPQTGAINHDAWHQLIDHLLASPHYGERWARHWMDVARFAESHGYEQDYDRPHAYHYRDFLIRAFNADMPYDQFVRWQLAGDEMAPEEPLAWMATGFLGAGAFPTQLTEAEFESARYDELDDMVATTGVAFLGLSVGCARCHDHKFDPITSLEYYRLASTFSTVIRSEKEFDLDPAGNQAIREKHAQRLADLQQQLSAIDQGIPERLIKWVHMTGDASELDTRWTTLNGQLQSTGKTKYVQQADDSYLATGKAPDKEIVTFTVKTTQPLELAGFRLEALADESLPHRGPGRADNGNFALGQIQLTVQPPDESAQPLALARALATHQQNDSSLSVGASIDEDATSGWAVDGQIGRDQAAVFFTDKPVSIQPGSTLRCVLTFQHPNGKHAIGRMRFSWTDKSDAKAEVGSSGPPPMVAAQLQSLRKRLLEINQEQAAKSAAALSQEIRDSGTQWQDTLNWFRQNQSDWRELQQEVAKLEKAGAPVKLTMIQVASEGVPPMKHHADGRGYPHFYPQVHLLRRGDVHQKGDVVSPAPLGILVSRNRPIDWSSPAAANASASITSSPAPSYRRTRLAEWLTDPNHGSGALLARVMVNRVWQHHFGRGLVGTPNDFGFSGEPPTHPELLEYLASLLVREQWKLKSIHRAIMTSQTYMLSSDAESQRTALAQSPAGQIDPDNRLYWRRIPQRLEAEAVRDSLLSVSGLLDPTMYGPGTLNEAMRRRSVYFFIKRSQLIPSMMLFDWPEHLVSIGQRSSTTIAPQALMLMNGPLGRTAAEAMAERILRSSTPADGSVAAALELAYQLTYQRSASAREVDTGVLYLSKLTAARQGPGAASAGITGLTPAMELPKACWSDYCQTLLSANEFIYID